MMLLVFSASSAYCMYISIYGFVIGWSAEYARWACYSDLSYGQWSVAIFVVVPFSTVSECASALDHQQQPRQQQTKYHIHSQTYTNSIFSFIWNSELRWWWKTQIECATRIEQTESASDRKWKHWKMSVFLQNRSFEEWCIFCCWTFGFPFLFWIPKD